MARAGRRSYSRARSPLGPSNAQALPRDLTVRRSFGQEAIDAEWARVQADPFIRSRLFGLEMIDREYQRAMSTARLVGNMIDEHERKKRRVNLLSSPRGVIAPTLRSLKFTSPRWALVCLRRKLRRQVMIALKLKPKGGGGGRRRRTPDSDIKC